MEHEGNPKVSIIVPVYNAEKTLDACIMSIMGQSYKNIECILIENGSTDNSLSICKKYSDIYEQVKVIISKKKGASEARNMGLAVATGEIIGFCDADDWVEDDALNIVVTEFQRNSEIMAVIGAFYVIHTSPIGIEEKQYRGLKHKDIFIRDAMALTIGSDAVMGSVWNKYYRAEVIKNVLFDSELTYCEDMHFNIKAMSTIVENKKVALIEKPIYCYRENDKSVTHQFQNLFNQEDELKYIIAIKKIMQDCILDKRTLVIVKMKIACFAIDSIINMELSSKQRIKLVEDLKNNYKYLLFNVYKFNWKWNLKRVYQGVKILLNNKSI